MTVTLEDWGMITGLPLEGHALTGRVERKNWHDRVIALIGDCPPDKKNRTSGVPLPWLLKYRSKCPEGAEPRVVERYARAYLWYLLTEVVFPGYSRDTALWMYLEFLVDWDAGYSWGAADLAYLYRSLDDATRSTEATSGMCGCVSGLSIWMWERIPVGRPEKLRARAWTGYGEDGDDARYPTAAYAWDVVGTISGESKALYKIFINELDALTPLQV
ncbi:hypothetical protein VPH35_095676 [Triticum aestivum]